MELMTVGEFIDLLEKAGVHQSDEQMAEIMDELHSCESLDFQTQYERLMRIAGNARQFVQGGQESLHTGWVTPLLENLQGYVKEQLGQALVPVPKQLHFVWVGSPIPQKVIDYVGLWAKVNPDYQIFIWYDSNLLCLKKLSDLIKKKAGEFISPEADRKKWASNVFSIRQAFMAFARERKLTDMAAVMQEFVIAQGLATEFETAEEVLQQEGSIRYDNIKLRDLFGEGILEPLYTVYINEAIQNQNFAALSDMARLLVLQRTGGIYIDVDMMPELIPELKRKYCENGTKNQRAVIQAVMEATGEIPGYSTQQLEQFEEREALRQDVAGKVLGELMVPLGDVLCHPMAFRVYCDYGIINQMVVSHSGSMMIEFALRDIIGNYQTMNKYFEKPPFLAKDSSEAETLLNVVTERRAAVGNDMNKASTKDERIFELLRLSCVYYETGLIKECNCTINLTGPGIYHGVIRDTVALVTGECSYLKGINAKEYSCFLIPSEKLSTMTEEEMVSSWLVR